MHQQGAIVSRRPAVVQVIKSRNRRGAIAYRRIGGCNADSSLPIAAAGVNRDSVAAGGERSRAGATHTQPAGGRPGIAIGPGYGSGKSSGGGRAQRSILPRA